MIEGKITAEFNEPRPLTAKVKTHVHGAIDIANKIGTPIMAIENGEVFYYCSFRDSKIDGGRPEWGNEIDFPWKDYFYDTYGGLIVLKAHSGNVHIFAHSYFNQMFNKALIPSSAWKYVEQKEDSRWPIFCLHTLENPYKVQEGEVIGYMGNAGFSTGSHVHWEIHHGWKKDDYSKRINPMVFLK